MNKAYVEQISTFVKNNSIPQVTSDNAEKKAGSAKGLGGAKGPGNVVTS